MDEQQNTPTAGTPVYQQSQEKNAKWLWLLIVLIIIGALVFAYIRGIGPFGALKNQAGETASPTPFEETSTFIESSPEAELDRSEAQVRVLNGSGTAGVASSMKDLLEGKGWKVESVGNAPNFDFENTVLRFKESFKKFADLLSGDLSGDYSVTVSDDDLSATDSADVEVIVGAK